MLIGVLLGLAVAAGVPARLIGWACRCGTTLQIEGGRALCRSCGEEYEPLPDSYLCGRCGQADVDWLRGDDIVLQSVTCIESKD